VTAMAKLIPPPDLQPPAHVKLFVEILGVDGAIAFLLEFGGAELYMTKNPKRRNRLVRFLGKEKAVRLARAAEHLPARIPTAKPWIAAELKSKGLPVAEIARKLHSTDVSVRAWIKRAGFHPVSNPRQLHLPLS
jgi:hypothetical protein